MGPAPPEGGDAKQSPSHKTPRTVWLVWCSLPCPGSLPTETEDLRTKRGVLPPPLLLSSFVFEATASESKRKTEEEAERKRETVSPPSSSTRRDEADSSSQYPAVAVASLLPDAEPHATLKPSDSIRDRTQHRAADAQGGHHFQLPSNSAADHDSHTPFLVGGGGRIAHE